MHGVHGTPPAAMLGVAAGDVQQVAGDGLTGLYRAKPGTRLPNRTIGPGVAVEAYSWGALTAGAKGMLGWLIRAPWLVLLPYALVNLAYWARPELDFRRNPSKADSKLEAMAVEATEATAAGTATKSATAAVDAARLQESWRRRRSRPARSSSAMIRVAGLLLTTMFILGVCTISVDLVAWQCYRGGTTGCPVLPGFLDFLTRDPWRAAPHRIALGTVPALAVLAVLWTLTHRSLAKCEDVDDPTHVRDIPADPPLLRHAWLWSGKARTRRLLWLHLATAVSFLVLYTGLPVLARGTAQDHRLTLPDALLGVDVGNLEIWGRRLGDRSLVDWRLAVIAGAALLVAVAATVMAARTQCDDLEYDHLPTGAGPAPRQEDADRQVPPARRAFVVAALLLVAQFGLMFAGSFGMDESDTYFGTNVWFVLVIVALVVLHLGVFLTGRVVHLSVVFVWMVVAAVLFAASSWYLYDAANRLRRENANGDGVNDLRPWPWLAMLLLVAGGVALFVWHRKYARSADGEDQTGHVAWRGAGASVFVAAGVWVGLLFTTSLVTVTANYLNGPDRSVADLGTSYVEDRVGFRLDQLSRSDLHTAIVGKAYEADGDVTLKDAVVNVQDGRVFVRSGTVELGDLQARAKQDGSPDTEKVSLGSRQVLNATLLVADGKVRLEDSCVRTVDREAELFDDAHNTCPPGGNRFFVSKGDLPVGDRPMRVAYDTGTGDDTLLRPPVTAAEAEAAPAESSDGTPDADEPTDGVDFDKAQVVRLQVPTPPQTPLVIPQVLVWTPIGQIGWLLAALLIAVTCIVRLRRSSNKQTMLTQLDTDGILPRDQPACLSVRWRALSVHRAESWLSALGPVTGIAALAVILGAETGRPPWELAGWSRHIATLALWFAVGSAVLLIWFASKMRTSEKARRGAGILWDLTTFWPRAAHPFAPPCYAERVVPELMLRTRWARGQHCGNVVVLSGHSQGAVLVAAAASRLTDLSRIRVITYGCQIRAWYGRIFPAVFGPDAIGYRPTSPPRFRDLSPEIPRPAPEDLTDALDAESLRGRLQDGSDEPRWVNLYRISDPLGFRVYDDTDTTYDVWVREIPDKARMDPGPRVLTHGEYQHTDRYVEQLDKWTRPEWANRPPGDAPVVLPSIVDQEPFPPA